MKHKFQFFSKYNHALLITLSFALLVLFPQSCKKNDLLSESKAINTNVTSKFFNLPSNLNPVVARVAAELEKQNLKTGFITNLAKQAGFPAWDKSKIQLLKDNTQNSNSLLEDYDGADTCILIPMILLDANFVNAFISATIIDDSVTMRLFYRNDYKAYPYKNEQPSTFPTTGITTAEEFALKMISFDKAVFGYTSFLLKDKRLFISPQYYKDTAIAHGILTIKENQQNNLILCEETEIVITVCNTPTYSGCNPTCDVCGNGVCYQIISTAESCNEVPLPGGGGNTGWPSAPPSGPGGTGGGPTGGGPTGCSVGGLIQEGYAPPNPCNPPTGGNPLPPINNIVQSLTTILQLNPNQISWLNQNTSAAIEINSLLQQSLSDENPITKLAYNDEYPEYAIAASKMTIAAGINSFITGPYDLSHYNAIKGFMPNAQNHVNMDPFFWFNFKMQCAILRHENPTWNNWKIYWTAMKEVVHGSLDLLGMVPLFGELADLANGVIYTIEGDGVNATLSYAAMIPVAGWASTAAKYAKKTINALDGSSRTLKWIKLTNGIIDFGDRGLLRKVLGLAKGDSRIAHHIIPWEHGVHDLVQKAAQGDFHLNELLNGIPLTAIQHTGSHNLYNQRVMAHLTNIKTYLQNTGNYTPQAAKQQITNLINNVIKPALTNNPNTPINNIIF